MRDIKHVAASGIGLGDRDFTKELEKAAVRLLPDYSTHHRVEQLEKALVRLLQCGFTYKRVGQLSGLSIMGVMQLARFHGIRREPRKTPPVNDPKILEFEEVAAILDGTEYFPETEGK